MNNSENITDNMTDTNSLLPTVVEDYSMILDAYGFPYTIDGYYLQAGDIQQTQGWMLHISIVLPALKEQLAKIIPLLKKENIPFKIPLNETIASSILDGTFGYIKIGKVICVYPSNDEQAISIANQLISITQSVPGPRILTDVHLGGAIYTRYGSFNPVLLTAVDGRTENHIYDPEGNLMKDTYSIPFSLPFQVQWPFNQITSPVVPKPATILKDKYKLVYTLKQDARGDVMKGFFLKNLILVNWCVIKQAKRHMNMDRANRDLRDRLLWQQYLHNELSGQLPIPKVHEVFEENGDTYLVMDYIKGTSLDDVIVNLYQNRPWWDLPLKDRLTILDYGDQILDIVEILHSKNYVHRDITSVNFLVTRKNRLVMIDLELLYSITLQKPTPPFSFGTAGFMSPQQELIQTPTFKDDIYSIGATLIVLLTGLVPTKFATKIPDTAANQLHLFIQDPSMAHLIADCLHPEPDMRPSLPALRAAWLQFRNRQSVLSKPAIESSAATHVTEDKTTWMVNHAIQGLFIPMMMDQEQLWLSKVIQEEQFAYYQVDEKAVYGGWLIGISGVLYSLSIAQRVGFNLSAYKPDIDKNLEHIKNNYLQNPVASGSSLYAGASGIALTLAECITSGLGSDFASLSEEMYHCLQQSDMSAAGIATGLAGSGIALMACIPVLGKDLLQPLLEQHVHDLLNNQQPDGSWITPLGSTPQNGLKFTGYSHGVAGIVCFLLSYTQLYEDERARQAAARGLYWLQRQSFKINNRACWHVHNKIKQTDLGMSEGSAGIALAFLKGYQILGESAYMQLANNILQSYPAHITGRDITLGSGITGIGEAYLEAYNVSKNEEWLARTSWIVQMLIHNFRMDKNGACIWFVDQSPIITADLLNGSSGIIHFLLRYLQPEKLKHPLLPV